MTRTILFSFLLLTLVRCTDPPSRVALHDGWTLNHPSEPDEAIPASVPGHVLLDLVAADLAPDPFLGTNEPRVQWVEDEAWTYTLRFSAPPGWSANDTTEIHFSSLDTYAEVLLDGQSMIIADNAHRPWTLPAFPAGHAPHELKIRFEPVAAAGQKRLDAYPHLLPCSNEPRPIGQQTSPFTRKANYEFGWDWGPRLAGPGIPGAIEWRNLSRGGVAPPVTPWCEVLDTTGRVRIHSDEGWQLEDIVNAQWTHVGDTIIIEDPQLWWPHGMGEPARYTLHWRHESTDTRVDQTLGLRTLEWRRDPDAHGPRFTLYVNETPVHARGANIIPGDFFVSRADSMWTGLVADAAAANMNMLRVWGGGIYPPDAFFAACDASGMLVWQDFMFACMMVPGDEAFQENVKAEAIHQTQRLRSHPSLALWCGNNEVEKAWETWGWQDMYSLHGADSAAVADDYAALFDTLLPGVVAAHSNTPYWPSSPHLRDAGGDEHAWGVWFDFEDFDFYSRHTGRFVSEYGLQSLPDLHTLRAAGITHFTDSALQYRQRSRMDWLRPGFDGWDMMQHFMEKTVGLPDPENLEDWIFRTQATQAEGLRQALERHRTSRGRYAGSLYWSLNDVWPAVSWSTVDHSGRWKLGHYAARRANAPRTAIWRREATDSLIVEVFNDLSTPWSGALHVQCRRFEGEVIASAERAFVLAPHSSIALHVGAIDTWTGGGSLVTSSFLDVSWTAEEDAGQATWLWCAPVEAELPDNPGLSLEVDGDSVVVSAERFAPVVCLTADVPGHFSDNGFAVKPGEEVRVRFEAAQGVAGEVGFGVRGLARP